MNLLRSVALGLVVLLLACRGARPKPEEPVAPVPEQAAPAPDETSRQLEGNPGLRFRVEPADAEVIIDEQSYGPASGLQDLALPPGIYRVAVKAPGHTTWRAEVAVGTKLELLKIVLPKR